MQTRILGLRHSVMWPNVVSSTVGLVRDLVLWSPDLLHPQVTVGGARISAMGGAPFGTFASGVGTTVAGAVDSTIGEALERYALNTGAMYRPVTRLTWDALPRRRRLPIETFRRFADGQDRRVGERNLAPGDTVAWVEATGLLDADRRLVPAFTVFGGDARWGATVSTGAAVGRDWASAVMTGAYEALERHAFISTWLTAKRTPVLRQHPFEHLVPAGTTISLMHVAAWDPVHIAAAVIRRRDRAGFAVGAACRPSLRDAALKAVLEALQSYVTTWRRMGEEGSAAIPETLRAHAEHYLDPRNEGAAAFLWGGPAEAFRDHAFPVVDSRTLFRRITPHVICAPYVVDLTTPELAASGLTAVKVLLFGCLDIYPGLAPFYGSDWNQVITGHAYHRAPHPFP